MDIPQDRRVEQTVKKQVTINAGVTDTISIPIPSGARVYLKGYGYTWYDSNTFKLSTGNLTLPQRTDQEGSASIPRIFDVAYPCRSGQNLTFTITNGDSSNHTYDVVFYLVSDQLLEGSDYESSGGELLVGTSSGSSTSNVTTISGSVTSLSNVETSQATAVGSSKILPIAGSDGTSYYRIKTDSAGNLVTQGIDPRYPNEKHERANGSVPSTGSVDVQVTLSGTNRGIREVYVFLPDGGGDAARVELYDGSPTTSLIAAFTYKARSFIILRATDAITNDLYVRIYGESGASQTGYVDVVYDHD